MPFADKPTTHKIAAVLLPLSMMLYVASLTMKVAHVEGRIDLHSDGIQEALVTELETNMPTDAIAGQVSSVINDVIAEKFPLFANRGVFMMVESSVREKVKERGPEMLSSVVPSLEVPQPAPDVSEVRLIQTIRDLWETGDAFLAGCILMFTIFFPVTKYIALTWLLVGEAGSNGRERVLSWLKSWGQWSMGDVFVVAFMVVFMKINTSVISTNTLADISVRVGVEQGMYLFAASVMTGMICSMLLTAADRQRSR